MSSFLGVLLINWVIKRAYIKNEGITTNKWHSFNLIQLIPGKIFDLWKHNRAGKKSSFSFKLLLLLFLLLQGFLHTTSNVIVHKYKLENLKLYSNILDFKNKYLFTTKFVFVLFLSFYCFSILCNLTFSCAHEWLAFYIHIKDMSLITNRTVLMKFIEPINCH